MDIAQLLSMRQLSNYASQRRDWWNQKSTKVSFAIVGKSSRNWKVQQEVRTKINPTGKKGTQR